jgi:hypothetical protein
MELMIKIYGLFKKMSPRILCTLTAPQNQTSAHVKECYELYWEFQNTSMVFCMFLFLFAANHASSENDTSSG